MKNLFLLATDKPSRLQQFEGVDGIEFELCSKDEFFNKGLNIYITSDEKPKKGEWSIYLGLQKKYKVIEDIVGDEFPKIILTTDSDLIKDGVQAIDDTFIQWFIENPTCDTVRVEREKSVGYTEDRQRTFYGKHQIIY